jgi:hypothetical protein
MRSGFFAMMARVMPLRWSHLLRNLQGLVDHQHEENIWAERLLAHSQQIFVAWRAYQSGLFDQMALQQALLPVRLAIQELLRIGLDRPWSKLQAVCRDLLRHWEALWVFRREEGVEPANDGLSFTPFQEPVGHVERSLRSIPCSRICDQIESCIAKASARANAFGRYTYPCCLKQATSSGDSTVFSSAVFSMLLSITQKRSTPPSIGKLPNAEFNWVTE